MTELEQLRLDNEALRKKLLLTQNAVAKAAFRMEDLITWGQGKELETARATLRMLRAVPGVAAQMDAIERAQERMEEQNRRKELVPA